MADSFLASEIQEAEIEALQAIFAADFEVVESKTPWKTVNAAQEFRICIRPVEEDLKDRVSVKIHFKLPLRYPKAVPTMTLEDPVGLSQNLMIALHSTLSQFAISLVGSEMIYELCSKAAENITARHQAAERGRQTSLGDQRKKRGEEEEKAMALINREKNKKQEEVRAAEASRLSMLISEEVRKKEEMMAERDKKEMEIGRDLSEIVGDGEGWRLRMPIRITSEDQQAVVKLNPSISSDWLGRVLPAAISIGSEPSFSATALVFDILAPYFITTPGKRKLAKVTAALDHLRTLRHNHIQTFYGSLLCRYSPSIFPINATSTSKSRSIIDGYTLIILKASPLPSQQTLEDLLLACGELRPDRAISYFTQLVSAVDYIHSSNVVHKGLRAKSVLIGMIEKGKSKTIGSDVEIKLSEVGWRQMLVDLNKSDPWVVNADEERPDSWISPEALEAPFVYDRSRDMWDLGVVFSQMLFGLDVCHRYSSPNDLLKNITRSTSPAVRKVLGDLLTDKKSRTTASKLTNYLFESSSSGSTTLFLSSTPKSTVGWTQIPGAKQPTTPLFSPNRPISNSIDAQVGFFWQPKVSGSRYKSEFEELEFLGRGGGGQVVKARNRLDLNLYAIKKIRLPNDRTSEKLLREVTIWSRMNHPNIVRYHTSWVETDEQPLTFDYEDSSTQQTDTTGTEDDTSNSSGPSDFDRDEDSSPGHDLDIDLGLDDLNNVDFLSVGHSKSFPSIHFGNEDDESRPASTVANSPAMSRAATRTTSPIAIKQVRTLYIQMEYVENLTLKEAIEEGITEVDSWRLMFQILSAMLHFTSLNIIHRDLKPSNIFIDVKGDVRIGDFGLAVNQGLADPADLLLSVDSLNDEAIDLTSGVGTSLYIAPESLSKGRVDRSIKYSNKIDMYSLGIVFFELVYPFKTGMERIQVLRDLRKPEIIFPSTWDSVRLARHTKIVEACLTHDQELRASPKDLLNSDLLPPRVGDDSIEETIRLLSHSGTTHAQTLITALFNQTDEDRLRKDFSYDFYDGEGAKVDNDPYGEIVRDKLSRIFRQKGAVSMDSPLLMPHSQIYGSRSPVRLLDADGTLACLPYHLNIPFCRMVARDTSLTRLKRWTIAPVYRTVVAGGQPRAVLNAAFDIVSDAVTAATEAECLYVVEEVVAAFPFPGETVHFLNHSKILDAIVERVPVKRRSEVLEVLVQHGRLQRHWSKTSGELFKIQGVTKVIVDEIGTLDFAVDILEARSRVIQAIPRLKHIIQEGFDELLEIVTLSTQLGVKTIKICPLLATNWDFHRDGVLFETHHVKGKMREAIATGGRFDDVVARLAPPEVRFSGRHVVGFSMSVPKLSHAAADSNMTIGKALISKKDEMTRSYGAWAVRRCDVYVVSFAPNLVEIRLDIVKDLWKSGMKADLMYDDNLLTLTPEQLVSACRREGILWLVIVKPGHERKVFDDSERILKVKSVLRGWEEEVSRSELPAFLQKVLREQTIIDENVIASGVGVGNHHHHHHSVDTSVEINVVESKQEIIPILLDEGSRQKGKYKQREIFTHKARKNVEQTAASSIEAPIFAIDVEGPAFKKMVQSTLWITDTTDESHLRAIQNISIAARRDYIRSVQVTISNYRDQHPGLSSIWLFSLREDKSYLLTF